MINWAYRRWFILLNSDNSICIVNAAPVPRTFAFLAKDDEIVRLICFVPEFFTAWVEDWIKEWNILKI